LDAIPQRVWENNLQKNAREKRICFLARRICIRSQALCGFQSWHPKHDLYRQNKPTKPSFLNWDKHPKVEAICFLLDAIVWRVLEMKRLRSPNAFEAFSWRKTGIENLPSFAHRRLPAIRGFCLFHIATTPSF
jgi:hypothetical protein